MGLIIRFVERLTRKLQKTSNVRVKRWSAGLLDFLLNFRLIFQKRGIIISFNIKYIIRIARGRITISLLRTALEDRWLNSNRLELCNTITVIILWRAGAIGVGDLVRHFRIRY